MKYLILALSLIVLTACNITPERVVDLNRLYCSAENIESREKLLALIREKVPGYPEHGECGAFNLIDR